MSGDRIDWISGKPLEAFVAYAQWREAIVRADKGDIEPLLALLQSETPLGPDARDLIAKFIGHLNKRLEKRLQKKPGPDPVPPYHMTLAEGRLHQQAALVRYWKNKGLSHDEAIRAALREHKRDEIALQGDLESAMLLSDESLDEMVADKDFDVLENFMKGRRGSSRRQKK